MPTPTPLSVLPSRFHWSSWAAASHKPWEWTGYSVSATRVNWLSGTEHDPGGGLDDFYVAFGPQALPQDANWLTWDVIARINGGTGSTWEVQLQNSPDNGATWATIYDSGNSGVAPLTGRLNYNTHYQRIDAIPAGSTHIRIRAVNLPLTFGTISLSGSTAYFHVVPGTPAGNRLGGIFVDYGASPIASVAVNGPLSGQGPWGYGMALLDLADLSGSGEYNTSGAYDTKGGRMGHVGFQASGLAHGWWTFPDGHMVEEDLGFGGDPTTMPAADSFGHHPVGGASDLRWTGVVWSGAGTVTRYADFTPDFASGWSGNYTFAGVEPVSISPIQDGNYYLIFLTRNPTTGDLVSSVDTGGQAPGRSIIGTVDRDIPYPVGALVTDTDNRTPAVIRYAAATVQNGALVVWFLRSALRTVVANRVTGAAPALPNGLGLSTTNAPPGIVLRDPARGACWWVLQVTSDQQQIWATPISADFIANRFVYSGLPQLWKQAGPGEYFVGIDANWIADAPSGACSGVFYVCGNSPTATSPVYFDYFTTSSCTTLGLVSRGRAFGVVID